MEYVTVALLLVLAYAGYKDYKTKRIPDVVTAFGWALFLFVGNNMLYYSIAGGTFAFNFCLNSWIMFFKDKYFLSWGDILLYPVYAVTITSVTLKPLVLVVAFALPLVCTGLYGYAKKDNNPPVAPFMFLSALVIALSF